MRIKGFKDRVIFNFFKYDAYIDTFREMRVIQLSIGFMCIFLGTRPENISGLYLKL